MLFAPLLLCCAACDLRNAPPRGGMSALQSSPEGQCTDGTLGLRGKGMARAMARARHAPRFGASRGGISRRRRRQACRSWLQTGASVLQRKLRLLFAPLLLCCAACDLRNAPPRGGMSALQSSPEGQCTDGTLGLRGKGMARAMARARQAPRFGASREAVARRPCQQQQRSSY